MQIDNIPLQYLTPKQAKEYKKIRTLHNQFMKQTQKYHRKMFEFAELADIGAKAKKAKNYIGRHFRDYQGHRFVAITAMDSAEILKCTMIVRSLDKDSTKYFNVVYNTSFGIEMLNRKGQEKEWWEITPETFEVAMHAGIKDMQTWRVK